MKIGLLNPWQNAAENQLIPIIARVAEMLGHTAAECKNSQDVLRLAPDLVIAMSRTQPKLTHIPTYGLLFDPRDIVLERSEYLANIYSYDGIFTLFDTLRTFAEDLLFAARRPEPVGAFFPTSMRVDWPARFDFAAAHLAYFGINWDRRRQELFERLDSQPWMRIYGPPRGWTFLTGSSYQGAVPFDGHSVMERYHEAGAGLCLFSDSHFADDVVSSRIFEVSAAGALILAPRMPWLERNFGDCILYIDQYLPDAALAQQIAEHMAWIRQHPSDASAMAARSEAIFRERFSLDVLLPNVFAHHQRVQALQAAPSPDLLVSVIVRAGRGLIRDGAGADPRERGGAAPPADRGDPGSGPHPPGWGPHPPSPPLQWQGEGGERLSLALGGAGGGGGRVRRGDRRGRCVDAGASLVVAGDADG